jgi:hypothetical protein
VRGGIVSVLKRWQRYGEDLEDRKQGRDTVIGMRMVAVNWLWIMLCGPKADVWVAVSEPDKY